MPPTRQPGSARGRPPQVRGGAATRVRITAAAAKLMRRRGFYATGLNEVLAESRAPKGSLYHYFPGGKEQLAADAITRSAGIVERHITEALEHSRDMPEALHRFARLLAENLERSGFRDGCPVATVTLDAASESEEIHQPCATAFTHWHQAIASGLARGGHEHSSAQQLAMLVLSAFEGALIMSRALRNTRPLYEVAEALEPLL